MAQPQTLVGMVANYVRSPRKFALIHEVAGNFALVQFEDGIWQLVSLETISECELTLPSQETAPFTMGFTVGSTPDGTY